MDTSNSTLPRIQALMGTFMPTAVQNFLDEKQLTPATLQAYARIQDLNRQEMSELFGCTVCVRKFYLIKEAGLVAAVFLIRNLDWHLLPAVGESYNYLQSIIALDENPEFQSALTDGEKSALRLLANACRDLVYRDTSPL